MSSARSFFLALLVGFAAASHPTKHKRSSRRLLVARNQTASCDQSKAVKVTSDFLFSHNCIRKDGKGDIFTNFQVNDPGTQKIFQAQNKLAKAYTFGADGNVLRIYTADINSPESDMRYGGNIFRNLNAVLSGREAGLSENCNKDMQDLGVELKTAIESFSGKCNTIKVYRGYSHASWAHDTPGLMSRVMSAIGRRFGINPGPPTSTVRANDYILQKSFWSTSTNEAVATGWAQGGQGVLLIITKTAANVGVDVSSVSQFSSEAECLMPNDVCYKVTKVETATPTKIHLSQVARAECNAHTPSSVYTFRQDNDGTHQRAPLVFTMNSEENGVVAYPSH